MTGKRVEDEMREALLTGAGEWRDRNSSYSAADLATMAILVSTVAAVSTLLLVVAGLPIPDSAFTGVERWVVASAGTTTLWIGVMSTVAWPFGWRRRRIGHIRQHVVLRFLVTTFVFGCWTALLGRFAPVPAWALGVIIGCEVMLTAWSLGTDPGAWRLLWWFERSSVHVGIVSASVLAGLLRRHSLGEALLVLLTFQVAAVSAALCCHLLGGLRRLLDRQEAHTYAAASAAAHLDMSSWLHDLAGNLRLARHRLEAEQYGPDETAAILVELESSLRLRQLDEALASDRAQLAEVLQPYVRLAQDHGVDVVEVPRFGEAHIPVTGTTGRLIKRALGVLVPNAIAAGAGQLAFRIATTPNGFAVEVEDDAGGFDLGSVPAGRALDALLRDLGPDRVTRVGVDGGSCLRVVVESPEGAA